MEIINWTVTMGENWSVLGGHQHGYGTGKVIVGGLFSDYAYETGQISMDEKTLVKGIVDYAMNPGTAVNAGQSVGLGGGNVAFTVTPDQGHCYLLIGIKKIV
jgi:hypothetical protein